MLFGNATNQLVLVQRSASATAGRNLTIQAGGATGTDLAGGELRLSSGIATGTGSSFISFYTATAGASGTTDRTPTEKMRIDGAGNVGIGTTAPDYKLDVASGGAYTARFGTTVNDTVVIGNGQGKLTVGTLDPAYIINGEGYATYVPGMIGQKEEVTGKIQLSERIGSIGYGYTIDFSNLDKGSDLWLFSKTTALKQNIDKLVVLLSPESNAKVWYKIDKENYRLHIYSSKQVAVSYRLTAPRFDWEKWPNYSGDTSVGFVINDEDSNLKINENGKVENINLEEQIAQELEEEKSWIIEIVKNSLKEILATLTGSLKAAGEWVFEKITTSFIKAEKVEIQTASIAKGIEMVDEFTGEIYCVKIRNGDFVKILGKCADQNVINNNNQQSSGGNVTQPNVSSASNENPAENPSTSNQGSVENQAAESSSGNNENNGNIDNGNIENPVNNEDNTK